MSDSNGPLSNKISANKGFLISRESYQFQQWAFSFMTHPKKLTFALEVPRSQESKSPCKISTLFESYKGNIKSMNIQMIDIYSLEKLYIQYIDTFFLRKYFGKYNQR